MRRMMLILMAALILAAMTVVAVPAMAQETKEETKMEEKDKGKEETKMEEKDKGKEDEKDKMKEDEKKDLPQSGGMSINAALLGLAAGTLLVGGGLVARRVIRQG